MTTIVVDASVVLKWLFQDPHNESHTTQATTLMESIVGGRLVVIQPVHWLAEVAAVLARETPEQAEEDIGLLSALGLPTRDDPLVLMRAGRLSVELEHHLFDTLYHAVALETGATLVTADQRYLRKAGHLGAITELREWQETRS